MIMNSHFIQNLGIVAVIGYCPISSSLLPEQTLLNTNNFVTDSAYSTSYNFDYSRLSTLNDFSKLVNLYTCYQIKDQLVVDFIQKNDDLITVLLDFYSAATQQFSSTAIQLEKDADENSLSAVVLVNTDPKVSLENINKFNRNYFLKRSHGYIGRFNYQVEQV